MKKIVIFLLTTALISCSEKKEKDTPAVDSKKIQPITKVEEKQPVAEKEEPISPAEEKFNKLLHSIEKYKLKPIDTLDISYELKQYEKYKISNNTIEIFKRDSFAINWIKINSHKFSVNTLRTINPRTDGSKHDEIFCTSLGGIKVYQINNNKILFMIFTPTSCNGLGCSVLDYLIYNVNTKEVNLFGSFRGADLDLYKFPISSEISYIGTEYKGDPTGDTPISWVSRIYNMKKDGKFQLLKDKNNKEYYFKITYPNDSTQDTRFKSNWF